MYCTNKKLAQQPPLLLGQLASLRPPDRFSPPGPSGRSCRAQRVHCGAATGAGQLLAWGAFQTGAGTGGVHGPAEYAGWPYRGAGELAIPDCHGAAGGWSLQPGCHGAAVLGR